MKERKEQDAKGLIVDEDSSLSRVQVKTLLAKNPQKKPKDVFGMYYKHRPRFD